MKRRFTSACHGLLSRKINYTVRKECISSSVFLFFIVLLTSKWSAGDVMKTKYPQLSEWSADSPTVLEYRSSSTINKENNVDSRITLTDSKENNAENYVTIK